MALFRYFVHRLRKLSVEKRVSIAEVTYLVSIRNMQISLIFTLHFEKSVWKILSLIVFYTCCLINFYCPEKSTFIIFCEEIKRMTKNFKLKKKYMHV